LRRIEQQYSSLCSALLIGIYWALWHLPLWWITLNLNAGNRFLVLSLASANVVAWSLIFSYLYNRSGQSLPVTILRHATYVAASSQVFAAAPYGQTRLLEISTLLSVCSAMFFGRQLGADQRISSSGEIDEERSCKTRGDV
jgi:membrane protease YdiL (CAAX protease family)